MMRSEAAGNRERQLRGLAGYCTKSQTWHGFQPVTPMTGAPLTLYHSGKVANEPVWACRYSLPELPEAAARPGRRRLIPSPEPSASAPTRASGALPPPQRSAIKGVGDPAARQLQRDLRLKKMLLKLRSVELIKELRTRALDTHGTKYQQIARLSEYLDKSIGSQDASAPLPSPEHGKAGKGLVLPSAASIHRSALDWLDP
jgi:hypothetical protein